MASEADILAQLATAQAELDEINQIEEDDASQFDDELRALQSDAKAQVEQLEKQLQFIKSSASADAQKLKLQESTSRPPPPQDDSMLPPPPPPSTAQDPIRRYQVNDTVTARYARDRNFYPATIVAVMGSSTDPIYTIKFKGYPGTEKVHAHDIRAISSLASASSKRKADDSPLASSLSTSTPTRANSSVISAAPSVDPALVTAARKQSNGLPDPTAAPPEKRLKKTAKKLEQGKQNWQNFKQSSTKGKAAKLMNKQSMFRTGDSATARVGFTGSGAAMREDAARSRHIYGNYDTNDD